MSFGSRGGRSLRIGEAKSSSLVVVPVHEPLEATEAVVCRCRLAVLEDGVNRFVDVSALDGADIRGIAGLHEPAPELVHRCAPP